MAEADVVRMSGQGNRDVKGSEIRESNRGETC